ncbi:CD225/dispanin family protein [Prescottella equi]|uniref:CD225/dispanin family protein n=1 Tax=Rhodococcus hoagii TaxID=43767 RepID=A0A9Q5WS27_RHOHA|nr:CD225/dispanin family protein [Prescottella equi]MBM4479576.1 CD225/dispanin family protein [Prescottella equi]MBM4486844.1 CD225/dispanin family protein [Prescottella equi]MBM4500256.1 CD225/dispanin family protein [Prescottella equi]MBM4505444.1 CD225/dispanin family protein [Prescottella equi]MBM4516519.1 CD225/dispanin family protein [Prescottella equi]
MSEPTYNTGPSEQYGAPAYPQQPYPAAPQYPYCPVPGQYGGQPQPPASNAGWAVASIIFFWPLAFAAFNHLHSIFPKWSMGDYQGAQYASERVKTLGKIALGIFVGLVVLYVIFIIIVLATAASDPTPSSSYNW